MSKCDVSDPDTEIIKLMNGVFWAKHQNKWYGSFHTRVGAEAWLEAMKDD